MDEDLIENSLSNYEFQQNYHKIILSEKYPIFYKEYKKKFNSILEDWDNKIDKTNPINEEFKEELFRTYCRLIYHEINSDSWYASVLYEIEKKGIPRKKPNKQNFKKSTFYHLVNLLFVIPDLITKGIKPGKKSFFKAINEFHKYKKITNQFNIGNSLDRRKNNPELKYKKAAQIIKILLDDYKNLRDPITVACNIAGCKSGNFSRWKGTKNTNQVYLNRKKYYSWQKELTENEIGLLKIEIDKFLKSAK